MSISHLSLALPLSYASVFPKGLLSRTADGGSGGDRTRDHWLLNILPEKRTVYAETMERNTKLKVATIRGQV